MHYIEDKELDEVLEEVSDTPKNPNEIDIELLKELRKEIVKRKDILSIYFGVPGSGKTTCAAWLTKKELKRKGLVYSNVPITGALELDCEKDIGKKMIVNGRIIIDEAGIEYNSRKFKTFSDEARYFFKYHRHYECAVDVFSQGWDDVDKTIRVLAQRLYVVKKTFLPWFIIRREIGKDIDIDKNTQQVIDKYYWVPFSRRIIFTPPMWKMFNTISRKEFPEKKWNKY
ncbi:hypothetical protein IJ472_06740 [bacterium]|nr:hypothetical protein [bacterium]